MQTKELIEFEDLVAKAKKLPREKWIKLKKEVEEKPFEEEEKVSLINLLLSAPTYNAEQLKEVAETRKAINEWRKK